jgi:SAM-dependent methyltransferase
MIKVLQDWNELGEATLSLQRRGLPTHETPQKNWDLDALHRLTEQRPRAVVLDLGCGTGEALKLLGAAGTCGELHGIDLRISWRLRLSQWKRRRAAGRAPFELHRGDVMRLSFADGSIDIAYAISVIEHGVDLRRFFAEVHRVLRPGGVLFVTTDYWPDPIDTRSVEAFDLPWRIFSRTDIESMIAEAERAGLHLSSRMAVPECSRATVHWQQRDYTFIQLTFTRSTWKTAS